MDYNAWKLTRVEPREKPRTDWPARWQAAGDSVNWQGALKDEFIALKTSPIWRALGSGVGGFEDATQSDSPPFAINSGMGWIGVNFQPDSKIENRQSKIENRNLSLPNEKGQPSMNQPNKVNLILLIAQRFTDEMCASVLDHFNNHPLMLANKLVNEAHPVAFAMNKEWNEEDHPRSEEGRFSTTGSARKDMSYSEKKKWDITGRNLPMTSEIRKTKAEIRRLTKKIESIPDNGWQPNVEDKQKKQAKLVQLQRQLANLQRDRKHELRTELESTISARVQQKKVKEFYETQDEIDFMEEKYGSKDDLFELKWPRGKKGEKERLKYEALKKKLDDLDEEIDWDKIEDDDK